MAISKTKLKQHYHKHISAVLKQNSTTKYLHDEARKNIASRLADIYVKHHLEAIKKAKPAKKKIVKKKPVKKKAVKKKAIKKKVVKKKAVKKKAVKKKPAKKKK